MSAPKAELAALFGPLVVLLHEDGADEPDHGVAVWLTDTVVEEMQSPAPDR